MMSGQPAGGEPMRDADQGSESALTDLRFDVIGCFEVPECLLDGDLSCARCGHDDQVGRIGNRIARVTSQAHIWQPPQQSVRVHQQAHGRSPRNAASISGDSSSKSSAMLTLPRQAPACGLREHSAPAPVSRAPHAAVANIDVSRLMYMADLALYLATTTRV